MFAVADIAQENTATNIAQVYPKSKLKEKSPKPQFCR